MFGVTFEAGFEVSFLVSFSVEVYGVAVRTVRATLTLDRLAFAPNPGSKKIAPSVSRISRRAATASTEVTAQHDAPFRADEFHLSYKSTQTCGGDVA